MFFEDKLEEILSDDDFDLYEREIFDDMVDELRAIDKLHGNLIMLAFDANLLEDISDEIELDQDFYDDHIYIMENEYGLSHANAIWVVNTCCEVYGKTVLMMDCDYEQESGGVLKPESKHKTVNNASSTVSSNLSGVDLSTLRDGEKLSKTMVQRELSAEQALYIDDISLTVSNDGGFGDQECIKVVGEITSAGLKADVVIFIMVYNASNELIGSSFGERIDTDECNGFASFSDTVYLPKGEKVSRVLVRPVQNPAGFW